MYRQSFQMKTYTRVDLVPRMTIILIRSLMTLSSAFISDKVWDNGEQWPPLHLCGVTRQLSAAAKKQWVRSMQLCRQHTTPWAESRGHHVNLRHNADLDAQDRAWRVLLTYLKFTLSCHVHSAESTQSIYTSHITFFNSEIRFDSCSDFHWKIFKYQKQILYPIFPFISST